VDFPRHSVFTYTANIYQDKRCTQNVNIGHQVLLPGSTILHLGIYFGGFISGPELGWLQSMEFI
jgi:hypothetical protein